LALFRAYHCSRYEAILSLTELGLSWQERNRFKPLQLAVTRAVMVCQTTETKQIALNLGFLREKMKVAF